MKTRAIAVFFLYLSLPYLSNAQQVVSSPKTNGKILSGFIENKGQIIDQKNNPNPAVLYLLNTPGMNVQLRRSGFSYDAYSVSSPPASEAGQQSAVSNQQSAVRSPNSIYSTIEDSSVNYQLSIINYHRLDIDLEGSNPECEIITSEPSTDYLNYYTTGTPDNGATLVHSYASVIYKNIYDNIDVEFIDDGVNRFKYNFIVYPGGKTSSIRIRISGATEIQDADDGLLLKTSIADVEENIPHTYLLVNGTKTEVRSVFHKIKENLYEISVKQKVPANATLTIDPVPRRLWGTYYGGDPGTSSNDNDVTKSCTLDKEGNLIITGYTSAINNIATAGSYQSVNYGPDDAYLVKFTPDGIRIWGTYYGGDGWDCGIACVTDIDKNIFLVGHTASTSNIASAGAYQPALDSANDAFIVKFNSNGFRIWGTYYGGHYDDFGYSIALDPQCNIYITGDTRSTNNMASPGAFQTSFGGGEYDAFLAKFDSTGQRIWGTYYGGQEFDHGYHCSVDLNGHVLLSGNTASTNNIASPGAHQITFGGNGNNQGDAFLVSFNPAGQRQWGTYYGGTGGEGGNWCYTTNTGKIYLFGGTFSPNNISTPGSYQPILAGSVDAFIAKFNLNGVREWGTYYGANSTEQVCGADYDPRGALFICGLTWSANNFASPNAYQTTFGGIYDPYLAKFDTNGFRIWCTYYGGPGQDQSWACVTDTNDRQYLVGMTTSVTGIASPGSHQETHAGGWWDGFIAKLTDCTNPVPGPISGPKNICLNSSGIIYSIPAIQKVTDYIWAVPPGATITAGQNTPAITVDFSGSASPGEISIYAINHCGIGDTAIIQITPYPRPVPTISGNDSICLGNSAIYHTQKKMTNYQWSVSPGGTIISGGTTTDSTATILWTSVGSRWIKINYTDSIGCNALTPVQFDVLVYPGTDLTNDPLSKSICSGDSTRILLTATEPGTTFSWTATGSSMYVSGFAAGSGDKINQKLVNTGPNPETVTYSITPGINGCLGLTKDFIVTINPILPVSVSVVASANPVCAGTSVTFTATPINGGTSPMFQWKVNGINVGTNNSVYTYVPVNGNLVWCFLTSSEPCTSSNPASSIQIQMVVDSNLPVGIIISASANPVCEGIPVTFTATPTNGGSSPHYQWKVNGSDSGTDNPTFIYIPNNNDFVTCTLTSSLTCTSNNPATSNPVSVSVANAPIITLTLCFDSITKINAKPIKLKGGIPLGGTYFGPGVNSTTGVFTPSIAGIGTKTITYSYTNFTLCSASKTKTILVRPAAAFICGNNLTDIRDNKVYPTVQIGSQCWMAADLNYGNEIPPSQHQRDNCIPEKYFIPGSSIEHPASSYQWDELMLYDDTPGLQGLCLPGWHVPTEAEWNTLFANWTNNAFAGAPLKYSGYSGFNALLSGVRHLNVQWDYQNFATFFWSSTPYSVYKAWAHGMNDYDPSVAAYPANRANAFPVRCLKD